MPWEPESSPEQMPILPKVGCPLSQEDGLPSSAPGLPPRYCWLPVSSMSWRLVPPAPLFLSSRFIYGVSDSGRFCVSHFVLVLKGSAGEGRAHEALGRADLQGSLHPGGIRWGPWRPGTESGCVLYRWDWGKELSPTNTEDEEPPEPPLLLSAVRGSLPFPVGPHLETPGYGGRR